MRLFLHLRNFLPTNPNLNLIKILQKYNNQSTSIILMHAVGLATTDHLIDLVLGFLGGRET